jgi:hypothetical protein
MPRQRGTTNRNARGSSYNRAARRQYLMATFGDGEFVDCHLKAIPECWVAMSVWTVSADRILPGALGGTYRRNNIRPACPPCQSHTGGKLGAALKAEKANT